MRNLLWRLLPGGVNTTIFNHSIFISKHIIAQLRVNFMHFIFNLFYSAYVNVAITGVNVAIAVVFAVLVSYLRGLSEKVIVFNGNEVVFRGYFTFLYYHMRIGTLSIILSFFQTISKFIQLIIVRILSFLASCSSYLHILHSFIFWFLRCFWHASISD